MKVSCFIKNIFKISIMLLCFIFLFGGDCDKPSDPEETDPPYVDWDPFGLVEPQWREVNTGIPEIEPGVYPTPLCFTVGDYIYMGSRSHGVFYSMDDGENWQATSTVLEEQINSMIWRSDRLLAATNSGVYSTSDHGGTWIQVGGEMQLSGVYHIAHGGQYFPYLYACSDLGIYVSEDNGETWTGFNSGLPEYSITRCTQPYLGNLMVGLSGSTEEIINAPVYEIGQDETEWQAMEWNYQTGINATYIQINAMVTPSAEPVASVNYYEDSERMIGLSNYIELSENSQYWFILDDQCDPPSYQIPNIVMAEGGNNGQYFMYSFPDDDGGGTEAVLKGTTSAYTKESKVIEDEDVYITALGSRVNSTRTWTTLWLAGLENKGIYVRGHGYNDM
ncbi:MAG: hypothetical protein GY855_07845 [candidate division Zixibacteria bacterium]|nr:hypothetical protein [candidate division Zixibacteria bacterium]